MKELLVDAIVGAGFPSNRFADKAEKAGLAIFTGSQWNERWGWDQKALAACTEDELQALYAKIKETQHASK